MNYKNQLNRRKKEFFFRSTHMFILFTFVLTIDGRSCLWDSTLGRERQPFTPLDSEGELLLVVRGFLPWKSDTTSEKLERLQSEEHGRFYWNPWTVSEPLGPWRVRRLHRCTVGLKGNSSLNVKTDVRRLPWLMYIRRTVRTKDRRRKNSQSKNTDLSDHWVNRSGLKNNKIWIETWSEGKSSITRGGYIVWYVPGTQV